MTIDHTHAADASSWVPGADADPDFPVQNLPLGLFSPADGDPRIGTAIGGSILDLRALASDGAFSAAANDALMAAKLNGFFALPVQERNAVRHRIFALLTDAGQSVRITPMLHAMADCTMHLPATIGDYTDFYVGIHHATNIGKQFRPDNPLLPNYKYVPIGYHGRASSIRLSGTKVTRPNGQRKPPQQDVPDYGPSRRLDYELEMGVWIAGENVLGSVVPIDRAADRIAGLCILNDWSARDLQAWEYQPLGPFLAKNFMSTISPWVITAEALAPFRIPQSARPEGDPAPLPYLYDAADQATGAFSIELAVHITTATMRAAGVAPHRISTGPASNMYWTIAQMITHHSSNGCNLMPGDLLGTGTISGPQPGSYGSMMEASAGGAEPITLPNGEVRSFLEDGDEVLMSATAQRDGYRVIGFGPCSGRISASEAIIA